MKKTTSLIDLLLNNHYYLVNRLTRVQVSFKNDKNAHFIDRNGHYLVFFDVV